jgi:hypothetical protein
VQPSDVAVPSPERFWAKVEKTEGCWLWTGAVDKRGYGRVGRRSRREGWSRTFLAHRVAYAYATGASPTELDHLCRVPACVRPDHLEPVFHVENVRRGMAGKQNNHMTRRTHCPMGHPLAGDNLYMNPKGGRECKECRREATRRWRAGR